MERLQLLLEKLHDTGRLDDADAAELESILKENQSAREYYILSEELHTMLEADKSIRLQLATDLLPDNVVPLPGSIPASRIGDPESTPATAPSRTDQKLRLRFATSFAAVFAALLIVLWMYLKVTGAGGAFPPTAAKPKSGPPSTRPDHLSLNSRAYSILSDHCFACHGENSEKRKAGLRLDQARFALRKKDPVIVPGNPAASDLVARVTSADPDYQMPPPDSEFSLSKDEIETLTRWVEQGAEFDSEWSQRSKAAPLRWFAFSSGQ